MAPSKSNETHPFDSHGGTKKPRHEDLELLCAFGILVSTCEEIFVPEKDKGKEKGKVKVEVSRVKGKARDWCLCGLRVFV